MRLFRPHFNFEWTFIFVFLCVLRPPRRVKTEFKMDELDITYKGIVYPWQCDHMGHMNVMWYVGKFDEATWNMSGVFGITSAYMKRENKGMVALEQRILYKRELLAGTLVSVRTGV